MPVIGVALTDLDTEGLRRHVADCVRGVRRSRTSRAGEDARARPPRQRRLRGSGHLHPPHRHRRRRGRPRRVRGPLPRRPALAVRHGRRRDRRRGPGATLAAGGREAVRPRPGIGPRPRRPAAPPLPGGPGVPGRPLPGQGAGRGPAGTAVRQHPDRAAVEPAVDRPFRDHDGRRLRRRRPRLVLRRRRDGPRRRAEPPVAGAHLPADGPTADDRGRRPARRQVPAAAGVRTVDPAEVVRGRYDGYLDDPRSRAGVHDRDLRRAHPARRRLALGRRAGAHPRGQGPASHAARPGRRAATAAPGAVHRPAGTAAGPTRSACGCSRMPVSPSRFW